MMKTIKWKRLGFLLAIFAILAGNLIGINVVATEDGITEQSTGSQDPPVGVLQGYIPTVKRVKIGEHLETWGGWVGAPFSHLVVDYAEVYCCIKTNRAMDGCKDLKICETNI